MADIHSVLTAIAADTSLSEWNPVVSYLPEYELKDTKTAKCCVVPSGIAYRNLSRSNVQKNFTVEIGFLKSGKSLDVLSFVTQLETLSVHFMEKTYGDARVVAVDHEPLFDADQLRTKNLFQCVIVLHLTEVK